MAWLRAVAALALAAMMAVAPRGAGAQPGSAPAPAAPTPGAGSGPPSPSDAPVENPSSSSTDSVPAEVVPAPQASETDGELADADPSALTHFKSQLDPHGTWIQDPKYGLVWVPNPDAVGSGFAPYVSNGHWALTSDNEWIWVSDYPFGDVVFHYGRWVWTDAHGWAWIPGRRYAHAWVVWRVPSDNYGYVGWAPAPPLFIWRSGVAVSLWYTPATAYVFCPSAYVFSPYPWNYVVVYPYRVREIARHTRRYVPPVTRARRSGPPMAVARIPRTALPSTRINRPTRESAVPTPLGSRREVRKYTLPPAPPRLPSRAVQRRAQEPLYQNRQRNEYYRPPAARRVVPRRDVAPRYYERRDATPRYYERRAPAGRSFRSPSFHRPSSGRVYHRR